ncbi:MAG: TonB-dependent copper receptor [Desulfovibrionaceae bacterium]|nr:TonB-dependent copper receptor [Desulfovibrionaceae bacterium]
MHKHISSQPALTALMLALLAAWPARAQTLSQAQPQPASQAGFSVPALDTVTVTATSELPPPLSVVADPKAQDALQPAGDGAQYLKNIPGFSAVRSGGANGDPVLRGMFGSRLNILNDGASIIGACPGRMDSPSSYISPESFDAVTVIKGPQTVAWGPGASAGTIRFERETPGFSAPGLRFDGSLGGGSFDRNDAAADLTAGNEKFFARVTANRVHSGSYKDGGGNRIASAYEKWNTDLTLGFTPDADTRFELTAGGGNGQVQYAGRSMDATELKRQTFGARFIKDNLGGALKKVEAQLYHNDADMVMDNFTLRAPPAMGSGMGGGGMGAMGGGMASADNRATWGGRLAGTWGLGADVDLLTGLDAQASRHRVRSGTAMNSYRDNPWARDATLGNTGVFAEATWRATQQSRVIGGARLDWASARDWRQTSATFEQRRDKTLPSGFVRYEQDLSAVAATWYVGIGHVERFPDYWELFSANQGPAGSVNAFQGIKPEKTTQIDFGARYKTKQIELWASGYAGHVSDFILFDYASMSTGERNINASIAGGELGASYRLAPRLRLSGTLAYAWGRNDTDHRALPQMPPLQARLTAAYDNGPWSALAQWRLAMRQGRVALNQGNVVGKDFGPSAGFGTLSLSASYAFTKQAKLVFGIDNVFNKTYSEHLNTAGNANLGFAADTGVNEPGRTLWARLNVKF